MAQSPSIGMVLSECMWYAINVFSLLSVYDKIYLLDLAKELAGPTQVQASRKIWEIEWVVVSSTLTLIYLFCFQGILARNIAYKPSRTRDLTNLHPRLQSLSIWIYYFKNRIHISWCRGGNRHLRCHSSPCFPIQLTIRRSWSHWSKAKEMLDRAWKAR